MSDWAHGGPFPAGIPWIGVDLDGTLAVYRHVSRTRHRRSVARTHTRRKPAPMPHRIGLPVPAMVERVRGWIEEGKNVAIFTARVAEPHRCEGAMLAIEAWCIVHLGQVLPVTNRKDRWMVECWDDRAVQVEANTGRPVIGV